MSTLLLDDALKSAMPLTNETLRQFAALSDFSLGSVATHLVCDGIIANFLLILTVTQFLQLVSIS